MECFPAFTESPESGYYAVIFTSLRSEGDQGYTRMAERMFELARRQAGYLGMETVRDATGRGIMISYWDSLGAIEAWKMNGDHRVAQETAKGMWYEKYYIRVCRVERAYGGD